MSDIIDRYIYEVTIRLPEKERGDVREELMSNIQDMLPDGATDAAIDEVLVGLGNPSKLADQYRQQPRYLISPANYELYTRILKIVLPIAGTILFSIGILSGIVDFIQSGNTQVSAFIGQSLAEGAMMGLSGIWQVLVLTTFGFAVAERYGKRKAEHKWTTADLPETMPESPGSISIVESVVELIVTLIIATIAVLVCMGKIPVVFTAANGALQAVQFVNSSFLSLCILVIVFATLMSVLESVIKIVRRRWSLLVFTSVFVSSMTAVISVIYLATRSDILNVETEMILQSGTFEAVRFMGKSLQASQIAVICAGLCVVIVGIVSLINCIYAFKKTFGARKK